MNKRKEKKLIKAEKRLRASIRHASKSGNKKRLHEALDLYLRSYSSRYVAVLQLNRDLMPSKRLSAGKVEEYAKKLNVWETCYETVRLKTKQKPDGAGLRFIFQFGIQNQMRQVLVRNAIMSQSQVSSQQYLMNGGRDKAIQAVEENYKKGFCFVFELDIHHCYKSFKMDGISKSLSLPKKVTEQVLSARYLAMDLLSYTEKTFNYSHEEDEFSPSEMMSMADEEWDEVLQGLTEGSKASPFAAELLLAPVLEQLPKEMGCVVNYADNFLCMCKSENDAQALEKYLRTALLSHPAGPLKLNGNSYIAQPGEPFKFLGYGIHPDSSGDIKYRLGPSAAKKWSNQRKRVYRTLENPSVSNEVKLKRIGKLFIRLNQQAEGYPKWKERYDFINKKMNRIVSHAKANNVPIKKLDKNILKMTETN